MYPKGCWVPSISSLALEEKCSSNSPSGWYKINTDGSVSGDTNRVGVGDVIRDRMGSCVPRFARFLGSTNSLIVELWAVREGPILARSLNIQYLIIELDAQIVVGLLNSRTPINEFLTSILLDYRKILREFMEDGCSITTERGLLWQIFWQRWDEILYWTSFYLTLHLRRSF